MKDLQDTWTAQLLDLCGEQGIAFLNKRYSVVRRSVHDSAVAKILPNLDARADLIIVLTPTSGLV